MLSKLFRWKGKHDAHRNGRAGRAPVPCPNGTEHDPWFWSHYRNAAGIVLSLVPKDYFRKGRTVLDFGCGDGATTLGVAHGVEASIVGVDLFKTYLRLPELAKHNLGIEELPGNIAFVQNTLGAPFPFTADSVDLIFSWSVFEHLADVKGTLSEFSRITRPGGAIFIQIEPLYFSPFGSHLQRLVKEPWAHLIHDEDEFAGMVQSATDNVPEGEKDMLYRTHEFDEVKRHLLGEYRKLNRITADQLVAQVNEAGFSIKDERRIRVEGYVPTTDLLAKHPPELLMTDQIVLLAVKG
jgi:ubiquinone/menaquinone biosynthesis C-methylase UbiE